MNTNLRNPTSCWSSWPYNQLIDQIVELEVQLEMEQYRNSILQQKLDTLNKRLEPINYGNKK